MATALLTVVLALFVGGLGILAQVARTKAPAAVTLAVVMLAASLMTALIGGALATAFLARATGGMDISGGDRVAFIFGGISVLVAGLAGIALSIPLFRRIMGREVKRAFWADPPVVYALWLLTLVLANNVVSFLIFTQEPDLSTLFPGGRVSPLVILSSQLPFVIVAVMGVGIFVRRNVRETLERLGYGKLTTSNLGVVAVFVVGALAVSFAADALFSTLQPDLYERVGELSENLFSTAGMSPVSAILFALLIGLGAGLGEETLFRGAIQPVFGIVLTSVVFASMHIQYGPSLLLGYIFVLSVGLGYLRKRINTTASFVAHAAYNALSVLIAYFLAT